MKRVIALILAALMLFALCACGGDDKSKTEKNDGQAYTPDYGDFYFESNGVKFGIMDYADKVLEALGEPQSTFESNSCAYQGKDEFYYYDGFEIMVNEIDGEKRITGITLADDTITNPQGVKIGMDINEALGLMGEGYTQAGNVYKYVAGSTMFRLKEFDDGTIVAAEYCVAANQEG